MRVLGCERGKEGVVALKTVISSLKLALEAKINASVIYHLLFGCKCYIIIRVLQFFPPFGVKSHKRWC